MNAIHHLLVGTGTVGEFIAVCLVGGVALGLVLGGLVSLILTARERAATLARGEDPGDMP